MRGRRPDSPRQACFLFGLRNMRPGGPARLPPDAELAERLAEAAPQDCLDAAFALRRRRPSDVVAAVHSPDPTPPPFRDVDYYAALARWLGCAFDHGSVLRGLLRAATADDTLHDDGAIVRLRHEGRQILAIAPAARWLPGLAALVSRCPAAARRLLIVPPQTMTAARAPDSLEIAHGRLDPLHEVSPLELADRVVTRGQAVAFAAGLLALVLAGVLAPAFALAATITVMTVVLVGYAGSRGLALATPRPPLLPRTPLKAAELPEYSVLIPLYREGDGLVHLVRALQRIDYPPDKLDIQFLVEADDAMTREALVVHARGLRARMTLVPPGLPRTKPRALNVGLRQARGSIVTIFDAEDRPDPRQLRIAAETFAAAPPEVAALQARLSIDHVGDNWLTQMFAIEYACLFDHIMPMVAGRGRIVLLGGTSNHFRASALTHAGGWDPYNVTEDADLAIRLRRCGYRLGMIDSETWEEAPVSADAWLKQRSRWFKGYIQTWLVHNRRPLALVREIGFADCVVMHLFIIGALTAGLAHLLFLAQALLALLFGAPLLLGGPLWLMAMQAAALALGYGTSFALGLVSVRARKGERIPARAILWFPFYWVLMGCAVALAIHDIIRKPHHWRKTTHGVAARPARVRRAAAATVTVHVGSLGPAAGEEAFVGASRTVRTRVA